MASCHRSGSRRTAHTSRAARNARAPACSIVRCERGFPVPLPSREAALRVWAAVQAGPRASPWAGIRAGLAAAATAIVLVLAVGWLQSYRVGVAGDGLPVLYREDIARVAAGDAGDGTLAVVVKRPDNAPQELRAVAVLQLQVAAADLPSVVEIRFLEQGATRTACSVASASSPRTARPAARSSPWTHRSQRSCAASAVRIGSG